MIRYQSVALLICFVQSLLSFPILNDEEPNAGTMQIHKLGHRIIDEVRTNVDQVADNFFKVQNKVFLKTFGNSPISHIEDFTGDALKHSYGFINNSWETIKKLSNPSVPVEIDDPKKAMVQGIDDTVISLKSSKDVQ